MGYLSQYDYYSVARSSSIQKDIDEIKKFSQGDYAESEMVRVCDNDHIRAEVVKAYLVYANGKKGIVYTINKQHNNNLCREFCENGIEAVAIDSDTKSDLREQYIEDFRQGKYIIICNVNLFTEGFDCPDIEFVQLARPTKSLALYLQQVGRGLRKSDSKEKTIFLDNVGLYNRFGFPSSRRIWSRYFEGKADIDNKEVDTEDTYEIDSKVGARIVRLPNLKEGKERVHLIQSSDDKEWFEEHKKEFIQIIEKYQSRYVQACDWWFIKNNMNGELEDYILTDNLKKKVHKDVYYKCCYALYPKKKNAWVSGFRYFYFNDDKTDRKVFRACKTIEEFLSKMDEELNSFTRKEINADLKRIVTEFNKSRFTENEFLDIIQDITATGWRPQVKPSYTNDNSYQPLFSIILRLYYHISCSNIKGTKSILKFCLLAIEETKRILLDK